MAKSSVADRFKRIRDLAQLVLRYGRSDLMGADLESIGGRRRVPELDDHKPEQFAHELEQMGPTFVKLGQLLSTRGDLLSPPYLEALQRLQDDVEPFAFAEVSDIVSEELGVPLTLAYASFNPEPLAAGSLGQVHRATLRDGRDVAVKVQRPGIREQIIVDLEALESVAGLADSHTEAGRKYEFSRVLEDFRRVLLKELDYRREAMHLRLIRHHLSEFPRVIIPEAIDDYCTGKVLTMEFIHGHKVTELTAGEKLKLNGKALADELLRVYLHQILVAGFSTPTRILALIDLGMVGRLSPMRREQLLKLIVAVSEGRGEDAADVSVHMGEPRPWFDQPSFRDRISRLVVEQQDNDIEGLQLGRTVLDVARIAGNAGIRVPNEVTMVGKALLNLDRIASALAPEFDANRSIRRHVTSIIDHRLRDSLSLGAWVSTAVDARELVGKVPQRLNRLLERLVNDNYSLKIDAIDERLLMAAFQKVANRITVGLILAALIIGAAMLSDVPTTWRMFGYPGLAITMFLLAAAGGALLIVNILFYDDKVDVTKPKKHRRR